MVSLILSESLQVLAHLPVFLHDFHFLLLLLPFQTLDAALGVSLAERVPLLPHQAIVVPVSRELLASPTSGLMLLIEHFGHFLEVVHVVLLVGMDRFHFLRHFITHLVE